MVLFLNFKTYDYAVQKNETNIMNGIYSSIDKVNKEKFNVMRILTQQREMLNNGDDIPDGLVFQISLKSLKITIKTHMNKVFVYK